MKKGITAFVIIATTIGCTNSPTMFKNSSVLGFYLGDSAVESASETAKEAINESKKSDGESADTASGLSVLNTAKKKKATTIATEENGND